MQKRQRLHLQAYPCRVCLVNCSYTEASILCDGCQSWLHASCISMSDDVLHHFSAEDKTFLCQSCAFDRNSNRYVKHAIF